MTTRNEYLSSLVRKRVVIVKKDKTNELPPPLPPLPQPPTVDIISKTDYEYEMFEEIIDNWVEITSYFKIPDLRKQLKKSGYELPSKKRIKQVFAVKQPYYKNIQNKAVKYHFPIFTSKTDDGAKLGTYGEYETWHPLGDIIIII